MKNVARFTVIPALLFGLLGCTELGVGGREAGEIPFSLTGVEIAACPMQMKVGESKWRVDYFGMYISNPAIRVDGKWHSVNFKQTKWQTPTTALLKFHTLCSKPEEGNDSIVLDVSEKLLKLSTNLRFTVGLPFEENHANPLTQVSPLNDSSMFWSWQNGHKFLRLDLSNTADAEKSFSYHLGSIGCESVAAVRSPEQACAFTNRVEVILPMSQLDYDLGLALSVPTITAQVNLNDSNGCMFESPEAQPCRQLLKNLLVRPWLTWD